MKTSFKNYAMKKCEDAFAAFLLAAAVVGLGVVPYLKYLLF